MRSLWIWIKYHLGWLPKKLSKEMDRAIEIWTIFFYACWEYPSLAFMALSVLGVIAAPVTYAAIRLYEFLTDPSQPLPPRRDFKHDRAVYDEWQGQVAADQLTFDAWGDRNTSYMSVVSEVPAELMDGLSSLTATDFSALTAATMGARAAYGSLFADVDWLGMLDYARRAEPVRWYSWRDPGQTVIEHLHLASENRLAELRVFAETSNGQFRLADTTLYGHGGGGVNAERNLLVHLRSLFRDMRNPYLSDPARLALRTQIEICVWQAGFVYPPTYAHWPGLTYLQRQTLQTVWWPELQQATWSWAVNPRPLEGWTPYIDTMRMLESRAPFQDLRSEPAPFRSVLRPAPRPAVWYDPIYEDRPTHWSDQNAMYAVGAFVGFCGVCCFFGLVGLAESALKSYGGGGS